MGRWRKWETKTKNQPHVMFHLNNHYRKSGRKNTCVLLALILGCTLQLSAQTYAPLRYYTFENSTSALRDSMNNFNLDATTYGSAYSINAPSGSPGVGKYMTWTSATNQLRAGNLNIDSCFTIEFIFRPGYNFNTSNFFQRGDGAIQGRIGYPYITFDTYINNYTGGISSDQLKVDLNQVGRKTYGYYIDGNWHHIVFRYNAKTGSKQIWVDGQCPAGFSKTVANTGSFPNTNSLNEMMYLNWGISYVKYFGDIDEVAIYNYMLPDKQIYRHYLDFIAGSHYTFAASSTTVPPPSSVTGTIDPVEYGPGHPSVNVSGLDQMKTFPAARFKPGHTLMKNVNWMDAGYMGGHMMPGVSMQQAAVTSTEMQVDLYKNFNYYFMVDFGNTSIDTAWINTANRNPDYKLAIRIFRSALNGGSCELEVQNKPNDHYLQNSSGQFLDVYGNVTTTNKVWRPTAPTSSYNNDGNTYLSDFNSFYAQMSRGVDLISEGGELFPHITATAGSKDPVVEAARVASGMSWENFLSSKVRDNQVNSFRNIILSHSRHTNTKYTEYDIDGYAPSFAFEYAQRRMVNSQINNQYYPTPSLYTRWPEVWRTWIGWAHGWQWVVDCRYQELALGDRLYAPFISPGWDPNEENNIRPGQWLGLLKTFAMSGAEFFHPAYFSHLVNWPDPKLWVWQAVIPAYAQGITSRYEEYIRNGELMTGDVPNLYYNPTKPGYSFWAGDQRKLVVIRKHNAGNKYAITGTIQPLSNIAGNTENESTAQITLNGQVLKFKVRRQGSTYIYDNTNTSAPVFYQLDGWHEKSHPYSWSKDFQFEGELYDNVTSGAFIKTYNPAGTAAGDFTNFTSCVAFTALTDVKYNFVTRMGANATQYFWIRARSKGGTSTGFVVSVDGANSKTFECITDTNWVWYRFDRNSTVVSWTGLSTGSHELKITPLNTSLEIDRVALIGASGAVYSNTTNPCGTASQATITASGPTTFCTGGSVTLTASAGTSYLWSNWATSQSINVTASGTYTVTVTTASGTAVSAPVTVTVNPQPTATISASGPTTFCAGGSVVLTSSAGSSYLWSPGNQTTQSITVTTSGTYNVRVTNSSGCSKVSSNTVVTVNSGPTATITAGGPTTFCTGGSVTLTSSAGSSYLWSPGNQTTQSISVSSSGTYTVRVTGSNGCSTVSSGTVVSVGSAPPATITPSGSTTICSGNTVTLTASSGTSYLWTPGNQTSQSITVSTAGTYSVRVTQSGGCSSVSPGTTVTVNALPTATITPSGPTTFCSGGSVTLTSSSGSAYLWTPGNQTSQSITVTTAGTYAVRVTGSNGCTKMSSNTAVTVNALPTASISASGPTTFCDGGSVTLTSSAGASYLWSNWATSQSIVVTSTGTYNVTVTGSNGCSKTATAVPVSEITCTTCAPPFGMVTNNVTASTATVSWTNPNSGQTEFQVRLRNMNTWITYYLTWVPSTTTQITTSVSPSTNYRWWVRAKCGTINSSYNGYLSFTTPAVRIMDPAIPEETDLTPVESSFLEEDDETVMVDLDQDEVQIFPNPSAGEASLSFKSDADEHLTVVIMDSRGSIISTSAIEAREGYNIHSIDLSGYPKGIYQVLLQGNSKFVPKRLCVQ
jgi:hypothetical protein